MNAVYALLGFIALIPVVLAALWVSFIGRVAGYSFLDTFIGYIDAVQACAQAEIRNEKE